MSEREASEAGEVGGVVERIRETLPPVNPAASGDQEIWVRCRIFKAIEMVSALNGLRYVGVDDGMYGRAVQGIIDGATEEIIRSLGLKPSYECIPPHKPQDSTHPKRLRV